MVLLFLLPGHGAQPGVPCTEAQITNGFTYESCGAPPTMVNYGNTWADTSVALGGVVVIAAPSLAGAVASVRFDGTELVSTGGHGASFQFAAHYDLTPGNLGDECRNPTEAGNKDDDHEHGSDGVAPKDASGHITSPLLPFPMMNQSSSGLIAMVATTATTLYTKVNMANYVGPYGRGRTSVPGQWCRRGGGPRVTGYILDKNVSLQHGTGSSVVINVSASLYVPAATNRLDLQLPFYLKHQFWNAGWDGDFTYDCATGFMNYTKSYNPQGPTIAKIFIRENTANNHITASNIAVGVIGGNADENPRTLVTFPYTFVDAMFDAPMIANYALFGSWNYSIPVPSGATVAMTSYFVVGRLSDVQETLTQLCQTLGRCSGS